MLMRPRWLVTTLALSVLAACSNIPEKAPASKAKHWSVSGRVGLWANGQQESANIDWQNCENSYRIRLSGPLGVGTTVIYGDAQNVSLHRGSEPPLQADSPEALLASMGWIMPVSALHYWLRGIPDPNAPHQVRPQHGDTFDTLTQYGWTIDYHPTNIRAQTISMESDAVRLKWILRDWQPHATCPAPDL